MTKRRERLSEKKDNNFQLKMGADVLERYMALLRKVEERNELASEADVNQRLLGLLPPDKLVTEKDILAFRGNQAGAGVGRARIGKKEGKASKGRKKVVNGEND